MLRDATVEIDTVSDASADASTEAAPGTDASRPLGPCNPNPCEGGGSCVDIGGIDFTCNCLPGFEGTTCEIADCDAKGVADPCVRGECYIRDDLRWCDCPFGYDGDRCEVDVDECAGVTCQNGGTCVDKVYAYECACDAGLRRQTLRDRRKRVRRRNLSRRTGVHRRCQRVRVRNGDAHRVHRRARFLSGAGGRGEAAHRGRGGERRQRHRAVPGRGERRLRRARRRGRQCHAWRDAVDPRGSAARDDARRLSRMRGRRRWRHLRRTRSASPGRRGSGRWRKRPPDEGWQRHLRSGRQRQHRHGWRLVQHRQLSRHEPARRTERQRRHGPRGRHRHRQRRGWRRCGFLGNGGDAYLDDAKGGSSFTAGGAGGASSPYQKCGVYPGGFGGGGGAGISGGGGGYSGGAAANYSELTTSGGGGSYASGPNPKLSVRASHGHGSVTIITYP